MKKMLLAIAVLMIVFFVGCEKKEEEPPKVNVPDLLKGLPKSYMSTDVNITIAIPDGMSKEDAQKARDAAFAMISEVEQQTSKYIKTSDVCKLNKAQGKPVEVSEHTLAVIKLAVKISEQTDEISEQTDEISKQTDSAFDITVAPLMDLWQEIAGMTPEEYKKQTTGDENELDKKIAAVKNKIGYENIVIAEKTETKEGKEIKYETVTLENGAQIDLGGIAKGYAVDKAVEVLLASGIKAGLVEAGGDLRVFGDLPGKKGWPVAVRHYAGKNENMEYLSLQNKAIATSGEYERGFTIGDIRYSHIINPKTGRPITNFCSVSVMAPDCATADALATAISVLGPEKGQKLIEDKYPECAFLVVWPTKGWVEESKR